MINETKEELNPKNTDEQVLNSLDDNDFNKYNDGKDKKFVNLMSINQNLKRQIPEAQHLNAANTNNTSNFVHAPENNINYSKSNITNTHNKNQTTNNQINVNHQHQNIALGYQKNRPIEITTQNQIISPASTTKDFDINLQESAFLNKDKEHKDNNNINNVNKIEQEANADEYQHDIPQKLSNNIKNNNTGLCLSLQCNTNTPSNYYDIGKFLADHIENEENYKVLFEKELKKLKTKVKKIFEAGKVPFILKLLRKGK